MPDPRVQNRVFCCGSAFHSYLCALAILILWPARSVPLLRFGSVLHCHQGTLAILLPSPASHEGTLAILRFQEDLGDLGTKYDGGLHARPPRFRGTQGTLAILGPRGHSSGPIRKQRKFPDFKVARSSGAIFWTEFDCIKGLYPNGATTSC